MVAPPPELCAEALAAVHCWRWCCGWAPERWPAYHALHDVADWQMTMELMTTMREAH